jgi:hypothetical protein
MRQARKEAEDTGPAAGSPRPTGGITVKARWWSWRLVIDGIVYAGLAMSGYGSPWLVAIVLVALVTARLMIPRRFRDD